MISAEPVYGKAAPPADDCVVPSANVNTTPEPDNVKFGTTTSSSFVVVKFCPP